MRTVSLRMLTWGTAAAAVSSALWLSSVGPAMLLYSLDLRAPSDGFELDELISPGAPPGTGPSPAGGSSSTPLRPPSDSS